MMSNPGASRASVPCRVAKVLKTTAISGGTVTPYADTIRNMSANASASGMSPGLRFRAMSRPSERSKDCALMSGESSVISSRASLRAAGSRFHAEVQLLAQRRGEALAQLDRSEVARPRGPLLQRGGNAQDDVQVTVDDRGNPWPLDLDHDLLAGV